MLRVLIVDHHGSCAATLAEQLFERGYEARSAQAGEEALQVTNGFIPNIAFIALGMSDMTGFELARKLQMDPLLVGCRFVAMTVHDCPEYREAAQALDFARCLKLPVDVDTICATIDELTSPLNG